MRIKVPDKKKALSIIEAAERDMKYTLSLELKDNSCATIVRNIYESFRMLGDALLVAKGIEHDDHIVQIAELIKLNITFVRPIQIIDNLRKLRHNINYEGYKPKKEEVIEAIFIAKIMFQPLVDESRKRTDRK